ncbi:MAG: ribosomal-protein-alanine N-acetyltransferase [Granulosicoccus sp.]|jgi:ribosomal-protein-alanine N-acetyltransferase
MKPILETERLILREWVIEDAENFFDLNNDPEVVRYTGDPPFESIEATREFVKNYDAFEKEGMGRWVCILKETGENIGWCGLRRKPVGYVDLGYRFHRKHWNKGFATEAGKACLEFGFNQLGLEKIVAHAMIKNEASSRVMQKLGMRFVGEGINEGHPLVGYEISSEEFQHLK